MTADIFVSLGAVANTFVCFVPVGVASDDFCVPTGVVVVCVVVSSAGCDAGVPLGPADSSTAVSRRFLYGPRFLRRVLPNGRDF